MNRTRVMCVLRSLLILDLALVLAASLPASASAQPAAGHDKHWGVRFTATPSWEITEQLRKILFEDDATGNISGAELTIGFVRGSTLGGDWGVSFVRKPWDDGSGATETNDPECSPQGSTNCVQTVESTLTEGVYLNGIELHWTPTFVTIKNRVQIGLNVAGGIGGMNGNVVITETGEEFVFTPGKPATKVSVNRSETVPAKDELTPYFPLLKLEGAASFIIVPALKVRFAAGVNFPAYSFNIGAVYLFGAN